MATKKKSAKKSAPEVESTAVVAPEEEVVAETDATEKAPKPAKGSAKEVDRLILNGTWVLLGSTDTIPEELRGHEAVVVQAPMKRSEGDAHSAIPYQYQPADTLYTVRTRDQYSATIVVKRSDFAEISWNGRAGLTYTSG